MSSRDKKLSQASIDRSVFVCLVEGLVQSELQSSTTIVVLLFIEVYPPFLEDASCTFT